VFELKGPAVSESNPAPLPLDTVVRRQDGVVLRHVAGEHMLVPTVAREVDLDSLFLLNATGVLVWELLEGACSVRALAGEIARRFGVPEATASADAAAFLAGLVERKLVVRADGHGV
jgi:hypothetical protein